MVVAASMAPVQARGGGLEIPDNGTRSVGRGGAYAAAVDEPSAVYYNPAALTQIDGFALTVNANLWIYDIAFQRAPLTSEVIGGTEVTYPFEPTEGSGVFPAPMLFASHDFGLEDWGFGVGFYGPSAIGGTSYGAPDVETLGSQNIMDETPRDFGHGYLQEDSNMLLVYFSGAVGYDFGPIQLGLTLQLAWMNTSFTNAADGGGVTDTEANSIEEPSLYTRNTLEVSGVAPTGIFGVRVQPIEPLTLSLSYRPRFKIEADGELTILFPPALEDLVAHTDQGAHLTTTFPDVVRFGARWAFIKDGRELADIELDVVYEHWSITEDFHIQFDGKIDVTILDEQRRLPDVIIPKGFDNTLSVRLGGDVNITDAVTVRAGAFYEGAANGEFFDQGSVSPGFANLDFFPFRRVGVALGASYMIGDWSIDLAYMHIFMPQWVEDEGQIDVLFPLWVCQDPQTPQQQAACDGRESSPLHAVNNGTYDVGYDLVSLGFTLNID